MLEKEVSMSGCHNVHIHEKSWASIVIMCVCFSSYRNSFFFFFLLFTFAHFNETSAFISKYIWIKCVSFRQHLGCPLDISCVILMIPFFVALLCIGFRQVFSLEMSFWIFLAIEFASYSSSICNFIIHLWATTLFALVNDAWLFTFFFIEWWTFIKFWLNS